MTIIRAARASDLASMYLVYYLNEVSEAEAEGIVRVFPQTIPPVLRQVFETGTMTVAEQDGQVIAFSGAITRGSVTFLTFFSQETNGLLPRRPFVSSASRPA